MSSDFNCPECGKRIQVEHFVAGQQGICRNCGHLVQVPQHTHPQNPGQPGKQVPAQQWTLVEPNSRGQSAPLVFPAASEPSAGLVTRHLGPNRGRPWWRRPGSLIVVGCLGVIGAFGLGWYFARRPPTRSGDISSRASVASEGNNAKAVFSDLPDDFAFLGMATASNGVDLAKVTQSSPGSLTLRFSNFKVYLEQGRDAVCGLRGEGLSTNQQGNVLQGEPLRFLWTPEPFCCYRDRQLIGIWDPRQKRLRVPAADEAPALFPYNDAQPATSNHNRISADGRTALGSGSTTEKPNNLLAHGQLKTIRLPDGQPPENRSGALTSESPRQLRASGYVKTMIKSGKDKSEHYLGVIVTVPSAFLTPTEEEFDKILRDHDQRNADSKKRGQESSPPPASRAHVRILGPSLFTIELRKGKSIPCDCFLTSVASSPDTARADGVSMTRFYPKPLDEEGPLTICVAAPVSADDDGPPLSIRIRKEPSVIVPPKLTKVSQLPEPFDGLRSWIQASNISIPSINIPHIPVIPQIGVPSLSGPLGARRAPKRSQTKKMEMNEKPAKPARPKTDPELVAAAKLANANILMEKNRTLAMQWMKEIVRDFPQTKAAATAKEILDSK